MALVVFLRGVNVGGHRTFRPSLLAKALSTYDVVNVGAAGTLVVRKPGPRATFRADLLRNLPFETEIALCDGRDLLRLETENPFEAEPANADVVRFVSILSDASRVRASIPFALPAAGEWLLRVIASRKRFVFGLYRRHMKTIGYLGQLDRLLGAPVTTRNWNTITAVLAILKREGKSVSPGTRRRTSIRTASRSRGAPPRPSGSPEAGERDRVRASPSGTAEHRPGGESKLTNGASRRNRRGPHP